MKKNAIKQSIKKVKLSLGQRSHEIYIGPTAIHHAGKWLAHRPSKRAFIIADKKLNDARKGLTASLEKAQWETYEILVEAGEELKDFHTLYPLYADLLKGKANRDSVLFAVGGGTVGDAAGFIASTYLRGISWVGVPTTLLAQVDSAIGGKTGINHSAGKNLIGSFHQPTLVICDTHFLKTLGSRELVSGFGEMVKYGLIFDASFFNFLKTNGDRILAMQPDLLSKAIQKCVQWKAKVVAKDEFDRKGVREALNFGHTFGHALESITEYKTFQHGEAVIWGMRFALALSEVRKKLPSKKSLALDDFLSKLEVPTLPNDFSPEKVFEFMSQDKKVRNGKIHFVLLKDLGQTVSDSSVTEQDLHRSFQLLKERDTG